jgi:deazaflavin-dependent oxidoreductase (nitroreductase family)
MREAPPFGENPRMTVQLTPSGARGARPPMPPRFLAKILLPIGNLIFRVLGKKLINVTTVGAKSGREHIVTLIYQPDGDNAWLVVASAGGTAKHPAWYHNMAKNPDKIWVEVGGRKQRVQAETLTGEERARAWERMLAVWPGYAGYQENTDRVIPVVRLTSL